MKLNKVISLALVFAMLISAMCFTTASADDIYTVSDITISSRGYCTVSALSAKPGAYHVAYRSGDGKLAGVRFGTENIQLDANCKANTILRYSMDVEFLHGINNTQIHAVTTGGTFASETGASLTDGAKGQIDVVLDLSGGSFWANFHDDATNTDTVIRHKGYSGLISSITKDPAPVLTAVELQMGSTGLSTADIPLYELSNVKRYQYAAGVTLADVRAHIADENFFNRPVSGNLNAMARYNNHTVTGSNGSYVSTGSFAAYDVMSNAPGQAIFLNLPSNVDFNSDNKYLVYKCSFSLNDECADSIELGLTYSTANNTEDPAKNNGGPSVANLATNAITMRSGHTYDLNVIFDLVNKTYNTYLDGQLIGSGAVNSSVTTMRTIRLWYTHRNPSGASYNMPYTATYKIYPGTSTFTLSDVVAAEVGQVVTGPVISELYWNGGVNEGDEEYLNLVTYEPIPEGYKLFIAVYDEADTEGSETLITAFPIDSTTEYTNHNNGTTKYTAAIPGVKVPNVKFFIWDANYNPLDAARTVRYFHK